MDLREALQKWSDHVNAEGLAALEDAGMPHAAAPGESEKTADVTNDILADASADFRNETGE